MRVKRTQSCSVNATTSKVFCFRMELLPIFISIFCPIQRSLEICYIQYRLMSDNYEAVIGLECHAQLLTKSKLFCSCSTKFGEAPNTNTCPVCLGLPGALPVLNRVAVSLAVRAALGLNCKINPESQWARKNYFYPDLPKGYQISQYDRPLAQHGFIEIEAVGE